MMTSICCVRDNKRHLSYFRRMLKIEDPLKLYISVMMVFYDIISACFSLMVRF